MFINTSLSYIFIYFFLKFDFLKNQIWFWFWFFDFFFQVLFITLLLIDSLQQFQLSSIDRSLLICTAESDTTGNDLEIEKNLTEETLVRVALADLIGPRQWFHVAIVLTRSVLKHSQAWIYLIYCFLSLQIHSYFIFKYLFRFSGFYIY